MSFVAGNRARVTGVSPGEAVTGTFEETLCLRNDPLGRRRGVISAPGVRGRVLILLDQYNTAMSVSDILSEDVVTVYLEDNLLEVADVLREEKVGSAVVVDADGGVVGMVTDRDLVVFGRNFADDLERTTVNEILSMNVVSVAPDTTVAALTETMREERVRRVPVVEDGELRGIVTLDDVVVHLAETLDSPELRNLAGVIAGESPSRNGSPDG